MTTRFPGMRWPAGPLGLLAAILAVAMLAPGEPAHAQKRPGDRPGDKGRPKHVFTGPAPAHPFDVLLGRPSATSVTVSVLAYRDATAQVEYGRDSGRLDRKTAPRGLRKGEPVEFVLGDLQPDTRYSYRLSFREAPEAAFRPVSEHAFHTQRKPGSPFVFTVQADSHLDQSTRPAVYERTLANVLADRPDFHIDLGDTFMTEKYDKYTDALPQYLAQRYYLGQVAHSAPLVLVPGNHDGERLDRYDGTADCLAAWSCLTRKKYFPNPYPDGFYTGNQTEKKHVGRLENYCAWEWGDALFVTLDPFWTATRAGRNRADGNWARTLGREQYDWLARTLAGSRARFKFIFIHHLVGGLDDQGRGGSEAAGLYEWGGKGPGGRDEFQDRRPGWGLPIHAMLVQHKVSAVLHGHDHFFARQELDGVAYLMVPQPGHPGFDRLRNADEYGYIRGEFLPPSGHVRVTVSAEKATVEYVRAYLPQSETPQRKNGQVASSFTIRP